MADQNNSASSANLNSRTEPEEEFQSIFHIPKIQIIPILPILIPEETKKPPFSLILFEWAIWELTQQGVQTYLFPIKR